MSFREYMARGRQTYPYLVEVPAGTYDTGIGFRDGGHLMIIPARVPADDDVSAFIDGRAAYVLHERANGALRLWAVDLDSRVVEKPVVFNAAQVRALDLGGYSTQGMVHHLLQHLSRVR